MKALIENRNVSRNARLHLHLHLPLASSGEHLGCPFATQEESGFEDELPTFSFLSFDPIMVAEQFTLMDAVSVESNRGVTERTERTTTFIIWRKPRKVKMKKKMIAIKILMKIEPLPLAPKSHHLLGANLFSCR